MSNKKITSNLGLLEVPHLGRGGAAPVMKSFPCFSFGKVFLYDQKSLIIIHQNSSQRLVNCNTLIHPFVWNWLLERLAEKVLGLLTMKTRAYKIQIEVDLVIQTTTVTTVKATVNRNPLFDTSSIRREFVRNGSLVRKRSKIFRTSTPSI